MERSESARPEQAGKHMDPETTVSEKPPFEMVWKSSRDSRGRLSLACRRTDTGQATTWADEFYEQQFAGEGRMAILRSGFRQIDQSLCWYMFDSLSPGLVRYSLRLLCLPLLLISFGIAYFRVSWGLLWNRR